MAMNRVKVGLATVRGASVPYPAGGKTRVVAVDIDLAALESKNLASQDVVNAINAQNFMLPSGTAKIGETEYSISLNTNPGMIAAFNDLPLQTVGGAVIRIGDVAQVHDGYQPQQNWQITSAKSRAPWMYVSSSRPISPNCTLPSTAPRHLRSD
jgi:multidrug efflux pump subunit AcrB